VADRLAAFKALSRNNEREERYAGWRRAVAGVLETVP
jgi:hypothetical protein